MKDRPVIPPEFQGDSTARKLARGAYGRGVDDEKQREAQFGPIRPMSETRVEQIAQDTFRTMYVARRSQALHENNVQRNRLLDIVRSEPDLRDAIKNELREMVREMVDFGAIMTVCATDAAQRAYSEGVRAGIVTEEIRRMIAEEVLKALDIPAEEK